MEIFKEVAGRKEFASTEAYTYFSLMCLCQLIQSHYKDDIKFEVICHSKLGKKEQDYIQSVLDDLKKTLPVSEFALVNFLRNKETGKIKILIASHDCYLQPIRAELFNEILRHCGFIETHKNEFIEDIAFNELDLNWKDSEYLKLDFHNCNAITMEDIEKYYGGGAKWVQNK